MDNGNRLRTYFLEMEQIKQGILDKWPGQFPPGDEGKLVQQLANDSLMCTQQNPRACLKAGIQMRPDKVIPAIKTILARSET
jgi:hypothetical protein